MPRAPGASCTTLPANLSVQDFVPRLPSHIPSLDGLRAISILFVLLSHLTGTTRFPSYFNFFANFGNFGVRVFFVISGFLITTLLLKEMAATGKISVKEFYLRRVYRIFPAFYAYAGVILLLYLSGAIALLPNDVLHCFTYTMNYHHPHSWYLAHIWSLSVEEQFYLLWPAVLLMVGFRRGMMVAAGVILAVPLIRFVTYSWITKSIGVYQHFQSVCDALAFGCLLAGSHVWLGRQDYYMRLIRSRWFFLIPAAAMAANVLQDRPRIYHLFGQTFINLCIALTVDRMVRFPTGVFGAILNWSPIRFSGVLSYSLYLWQQVFLNRHSPGVLTSFPQNIALVALAALTSYYLVERPFLRLKARLHPRTG